VNKRASIGKWLGWVATAAAAIVAMIPAVGVSAGHIWARSAPDMAMLFWPRVSEPMAQRAGRLLSDQNATKRAKTEAEALAHEAIVHDPTNVTAIRMRGLLAAIRGDARIAQQWMAQAEALSRRDLPTHLWFIENAVARNDIDGALIHYDRALRTSREAPDLLFPLLIGASADPAVAEPLSRLVARRPGWWGPFMNRMIGESRNTTTLDLFARRLRLSPADPQHPDFFGRILQKMVEEGAFGQADALYRSVLGSDAAGPLRDGGFERDGGVPPFAWRFADDSDLSARVEPRPDGRSGRAMMIDANSGRGGEVATQALALTPGRYVLRGETAETGAEEEARPLLRLRCGSGQKAELAAVVLPSASARPRVFAFAITVPADCRGAWLSVEARAGLGGQADARPWIDNVSLTRDTRL
jgi:hypothetical protein